MFMKEAKKNGREIPFFAFVLTYYSMENNACSLAFFILRETTYTPMMKKRTF